LELQGSTQRPRSASLWESCRTPPPCPTPAGPDARERPNRDVTGPDGCAKGSRSRGQEARHLLLIRSGIGGFHRAHHPVPAPTNRDPSTSSPLPRTTHYFPHNDHGSLHTAHSYPAL